MYRRQVSTASGTNFSTLGCNNSTDEPLQSSSEGAHTVAMTSGWQAKHTSSKSAVHTGRRSIAYSCEAGACISSTDHSTCYDAYTYNWPQSQSGFMRRGAHTGTLRRHLEVDIEMQTHDSPSWGVARPPTDKQHKAAPAEMRPTFVLAGAKTTAGLSCARRTRAAGGQTLSLLPLDRPRVIGV